MNIVGKRLVVTGLVASLLLTGCQTIDLASYPNISKLATQGFDVGNVEEVTESVQDISENVSEISAGVAESSQELSESIADTTEAAVEAIQEVTDYVTDDSIAELVANTTELAADVQAIAVADISQEDIANAVAEQIAGTVMEEVQKYAERGAKVLQEASEKIAKGVGMIQASVVKLTEELSDDTLPEEVITETFTQSKEALKGTDEISGGATLVFQEAVRDAREIIATADAYGIQTEEIDQLADTLDEMQDWEVYILAGAEEQLDAAEEYALYVVQNTTYEDVENAVSAQAQAAADAAVVAANNAYAVFADKEQSDAVIISAFDSARQVLDQAEATSDMATQILQDSSNAALQVIAQAESFGIQAEEIDAVEAVLEFTKDAYVEIELGVNKEDLDQLQQLVIDAMDQARAFDTVGLIETANEVLAENGDLVNDIASASSIGEILLILQENGVVLSDDIIEEYTGIAANQIAEYYAELEEAITTDDEAEEEVEEVVEDDAEAEEAVEEEVVEEAEEEIPAKAAPDSDIVVLYTNDVHGAVNTNLGYSKVAAYKAQVEEEGSYAILADGGDFITEGNDGAFSAGLDLVDVMNATGYDVASIGDHELDYGIRQLRRYQAAAEFPMICSNLVNKNTGESVLDSYAMFEVGGVNVAFVGVVTPDTKNVNSIKKFLADYPGYDVCGGETADLLIENVQGSIDAAKQDGADYVILVSHLGINEASAPYTTQNVVAGLTGIDAVLGGHTHVAGKDIEIVDAEGNTLEFLRTGKFLANIGKLTIGADGTISTDLVSSVDSTDSDVDAIIAGLFE